MQSRQSERCEEGGDLEEEDRHPDLRQAIRAPQSKNPKREEPLEKDLHRQEELDKQMLTPPRTMRQREGSRTSSLAKSKSRTPLPQGAGGGLQRTATAGPAR